MNAIDFQHLHFQKFSSLMEIGHSGMFQPDDEFFYVEATGSRCAKINAAHILLLGLKSLDST